MTTPSTIHREDNGRITCTVSFSAEEATSSEEKALQKLGTNVQVDGFRKGAVPGSVLREKIDPAKLFEETVRGLLPGAFTSLVQEHDIKPVISPKVEITGESPITIKVTFVERPKVKIKGASKISVKMQKPIVEEKDLEQMIGYMLKQHQTSKPVDRPAQEGDRITMDFWGEAANGKEIESIRTNGHQVVVGSKVLLPGFEEQLKGLKKGASKDFTLPFPEKHQSEELRGKPVTFHVIVKAVEELSTPELTDAFVQKQMQTDSVDAFKKQVRESMEAQEESMLRRKTEEEAFEKIREATKVDIVPEFIEDEKQSLFEELAKQLDRQKMSFPDWLTQTGKKPEEVEKDLEEQAEKRITLRLGISALMEEKEIDVTDDEMKKVVEALVSPLSVEERLKIAPNYAKGEQAYEQLKWQKKVEKLLDSITRN
ncbi:trigger factor [Candidatus Peregrinibacteria bacterium CG10_big_fil_rev_8_21_14_0_10_49_10]|nr:MAG: trigger factor [Candidatus Peregrinibacteria bacterium CG10_big_fil_rev_8_21_14_0_10_49_10]